LGKYYENIIKNWLALKNIIVKITNIKVQVEENMKKAFFAVLVIVVIIGFALTGCGGAAEDYNIYFLGNSITLHGPRTEVGWYGNWGMAASKEENDYVHKLIKKLKNVYNNQFIRINYGVRNIGNWELNFFIELDDLEINKIDLLIIRLGENVNEEYARNNNYYDALDRLIKKYKGNNTKIIITDNYWSSEFKDTIQRNIAIDNGYYFVQINDLYSNYENSAFGQFEHPGVAKHPSDIGMENIAQRIFDSIKENKIME
jgi:hypothetical protein